MTLQSVIQVSEIEYVVKENNNGCYLCHIQTFEEGEAPSQNVGVSTFLLKQDFSNSPKKRKKQKKQKKQNNVGVCPVSN